MTGFEHILVYTIVIFNFLCSRIVTSFADLHFVVNRHASSTEPVEQADQFQLIGWDLLAKNTLANSLGRLTAGKSRLYFHSGMKISRCASYGLQQLAASPVLGSHSIEDFRQSFSVV